MNITTIGAGRAGTSLDLALRRAGHSTRLVHHDELDQLGTPDLVLLCVPDDQIAAVAARVPVADYVVAHVAGSRGLEVLAPHRRVGTMHPLMTLPSTEVGADRLLGATYCVAGDDLVFEVVHSLRGRAITLRDDQRTAYHATAAVAANHLVALMGHVEELARSVGLSLEDFLPLAQRALDDVAAVGPEAALTGPASRGDLSTIDAHLSAIPASERSAYVAMANVALGLAERRRTRTLA